MASPESALKSLQSWEMSESEIVVCLTLPSGLRFDFVGRVLVDSNGNDVRVIARDTKSATTLAIPLDAAAKVELDKQPDRVHLKFADGADLLLCTSATTLPVV
jgi:hypothetical protein